MAGEWRSHWLTYAKKTRWLLCQRASLGMKKEMELPAMRASLVSLLYSVLVWPLWRAA
jgi:hypothetical protein